MSRRGLPYPTLGCLAILSLLSDFLIQKAWGYSPVLPTASIPDLSSYVSQSTRNAFIQTIGFSLDHRPYEPATSLGASFDFGIETTVVKPPSTLGTAISSISSSQSGKASSSSSSTVPLIPSVKIHLRKGLGEVFDLGVSGIYAPTTLPYVGGTLFFGGDFKYVFFRPEESFTAAVRASYNFINLALNHSSYILSIKTVTITPQLIVSRKMGFADPYVGVGYQYTYGTISATVPSPSIKLLPGVAIAPISLSVSGNGTGISFFGGVSMLSLIRLRLTLEGGYNPGGEDYLGLKFGFTI